MKPKEKPQKSGIFPQPFQPDSEKILASRIAVEILTMKLRPNALSQ
jgi:hypothetical protein